MKKRKQCRNGLRAWFTTDRKVRLLRELFYAFDLSVRRMSGAEDDPLNMPVVAFATR